MDSFDALEHGEISEILDKRLLIDRILCHDRGAEWMFSIYKTLLHCDEFLIDERYEITLAYVRDEFHSLMERFSFF